jgi:REP element-mobilizing transposase RayT
MVGTGVPHLERKEFTPEQPVHVTQRMQRVVGQLRTQARLNAIREALIAGNGKFGMQVVHFSVQGNQLHLICEAEGREALSKGIKGTAVRIAIALNRVSGRHGSVFVDRYHARILTTPRDVANTLRYVLQNHRKHAKKTLPASWEDTFATTVEEPLQPPKTWLLREGWARAKAPPRQVPIDAFLQDEPNRHLF